MVKILREADRSPVAEVESARLKKMLAERDREIDVMKAMAANQW